MRDSIYSKIQKLETLLSDLSDSLDITEHKRYTASQHFKADNLHLAEGATLTINMHNALFSIKLIKQCQQLINDIKPYIPHNGNGLFDVIDNYKKSFISNALMNNGFKLKDTAKELRITHRQLRYAISCDSEYFNKLKEKENCHVENQKENVKLGPA